MTDEGQKPAWKRLKIVCSSTSAFESTSASPREVVDSRERTSAAMGPKGGGKGAALKAGASESKGETAGTAAKKRTRGGEAEGEKKKLKQDIEEWEEELPPAHVKITSPAGSKTTQMSGQAGARTLAKLQKSFTSTTLREQVSAYIPSDLRSVKADGVVEIPLGYLDTTDLEIKGNTTFISFNPRQLGEDGIERIRKRFRINGFDSDKSILTGVITYEAKQFNMTKAHMAQWDEVERERIKEWKEMLNTTKDKNKLSLYLWKRIVGGSLGALGFRIKVTDGKHRTVAVRKEQEAHFYNKDLDPTGARHPMVKVQLLNIMEADRGKLLQLMNTTNDYVAEGVQEQSLPMKMMTVRKCLLGLTEKTVAEFPSDLVDALKAMSNNQLDIEYTTYKPKGSSKVLKVPKLLVAMMCDRPFEDDVTNWKVPDTPKQTAFLELCERKQDQFKRLIGGANTAAGPAWDKVLVDLAADKKVAEGLLNEDLYALTAAGMSEDWCVMAARAVFVKTRAQSEEDGWLRGQIQNRLLVKMLAYVYEGTCEGVLWLREIGVLKDEKPLKGGAVDLNVTFASADLKEKFWQAGYMHFPEWVQTLVFAAVPKGQCETRFLFKQGGACRAKATSKEKSKDVVEAGRRAACQWLLWLFPPSAAWWNLETLYANVPATAGLKAKVVETIKTGAAVGKKWELEHAAGMGYKMEEEIAMGLPLERDCGGTVPPVLSTVLGTEVGRSYITREERAQRMGFTVEKQQLEGEGEVVTFNDADMYNIVSEGESFDCPTIELVRAGCEQLHMMGPGKWVEKGHGVDIVWLNVPLPPPVADAEDVAKYDIKSERPWEKNALSDALNLAKDLITSAGILVVIAPPGFPTDKLTGFSLGATGVAAEVRSVLTLCFEAKGKDKAKAKPLYGAAGNTLEVIFLTPMGSEKETACRGTVPDILADVPFVRILGRHGSFKVYNRAEWAQSGEGLPRKVVQSLLGGLVLKGGTALVLNAKGGREASVLSKGGMKVVAAYSEQKSSFQGPLIDTRTKKQYGGAASKTGAEESPAELVAAAMAEQGEKEKEGEKEGEEREKGPTERAADSEPEKETGLEAQPKTQPEGGEGEEEGGLQLEDVGAWDEEEASPEGVKLGAGVGEDEEAEDGAGLERRREKKKLAPLPLFAPANEAFGDDEEEVENQLERTTVDEEEGGGSGPRVEEMGGVGGLGEVKGGGGFSAVKEPSPDKGTETPEEEMERRRQDAQEYIAAQAAARMERQALEAEKKMKEADDEKAVVERLEEVRKKKEEALKKKEEEEREQLREGKGKQGSKKQGEEGGKKDAAQASAGEGGGGLGSEASSQPRQGTLYEELVAAQRGLGTRRSRRGKN